MENNSISLKRLRAKYWLLSLAITTTVFIAPVSLFAQAPQDAPNYVENFTPATANTYAFSKTDHVPLNPFTGQYSLSVPLFQKKMNMLTFNLTLDYIGSGGINSSDPGSVCGHGWKLNGGGIVMRSLRGGVDMGAGHQNHSGVSLYNSSMTGFTDLYDIPDGSYISKNNSNLNLYAQGGFSGIDLAPQGDGQLDIFEFNINGRSGKFYIGWDGTVLQVSKSALKIIPTLSTDPANQGFIGFEIIDENGIKYFFNKSERAYRIANLLLSEGDYRPPYSYSSTYPVSWLMTRMESPDGLEYINFNYYESPMQGSYSGQATTTTARVVYDKNGNITNNFPFWLSPIGTNSLVSNELDLKSIVFSDRDSISFTYFNNTVSDTSTFMSKGTGLTPAVLKKIALYKNKQLATSYGLDYMAYDNPINTYSSKMGLDSFIYKIGSYGLSNFYVRQALYLAGIRKFSPEGGIGDPYIFEYYIDAVLNEVNLGDAGKTDQWGFYNGVSSTFDGTLPYVYNGSPVPVPPPDINFAKMGLLKKVTFPTGGWETFNYELNDVQTANGKANIGGIRLQSDTLNDGLSPSHTTVKTYKYVETNGNSSGFIGFTPSYQYDNYIYQNNDFGSIWPAIWQERDHYTTNQSVNSSSYVEGSPVGYRRVEESITSNNVAGNGKIVYEYSDLNYVNGLGFGSLWTPAVAFPYRPVDRPEWLVGLPLKTSYYTASGRLLKQIANTYNCTAQLQQSINYKSWSVESSGYIFLDYFNRLYDSQFIDIGNWPIIIHLPVPDWDPTIYNVKSYYPVTGDAKLATTTETTYSSDSTNTIPSSATRSFTYETTYGFLRTQTQDNAKNETIQHNFYYPFDYNLGSGSTVDSLVKKNQIGTPIVTEDWLNKSNGNYLTSSAVTEYGFFNNNTLLRPSRVDRLETSQPIATANAGTQQTTSLFAGRKYTPDITLNNYDNLGRLVDYNKAYAAINSIIVDSSNNVIAKVENASSKQIAYENFESGYTGNWTISGTKSSGGIVGLFVFTGTLTKTFTANMNVTVSLWTNSSTTPSVNGILGTIVKTINNYHLYKWSLSGVKSVSVTGTYIDEVKCYPSTAIMSNYVYNPRFGLIGECSTTDYYTFYVYDNFNRLRQIKNEKGEIVKAITVGEAPVYFNEQQSASYTAPCLFFGSVPNTPQYNVPGVCTVRAGLYSSFISQADANLQALTAANQLATQDGLYDSCIGLTDASISAVIAPPGSPGYANGATNITITLNQYGVDHDVAYLNTHRYFLTYQLNYVIDGVNRTDVRVFTDIHNNPSPKIVNGSISTTRYYGFTTNVGGVVTQHNISSITSCQLVNLQIFN